MNNNYLKYYITILFLLLISFTSIAQNNSLTSKNDYTSLYLTQSHTRDFEVSVSAVAMFTLGAKDRNGFRLGGGFNLSQYIGDIKLSTGIDFYKAIDKFALGTTYAGLGYYTKSHSISYYLNKYYQGDKQISGLIALELGEFEINFEDDILSLPFTKFIVHDRFRTAAIELRYKHFILGTNVYTNEVNGLTNVSKNNRNGVYVDSKQISSPVYIGYTNKNLILRFGINSKLGGFVGQNWWHQNIFQSTDFNYNCLNNPFLQIGVKKPYSLY